MFQTVQRERELQNINQGEHLSQQPQDPQQIHVTLLNSINMSFQRVANQFDRRSFRSKPKASLIEDKSQFDRSVNESLSDYKNYSFASVWIIIKVLVLRNDCTMHM